MKLGSVKLGDVCKIKKSDLKKVKPLLGFIPHGPFVVLDHDGDQTIVLSIACDDGGRSFSLSSKIEVTN